MVDIREHTLNAEPLIRGGLDTVVPRGKANTKEICVMHLEYCDGKLTCKNNVALWVSAYIHRQKQYKMDNMQWTGPTQKSNRQWTRKNNIKAGIFADARKCHP